jgi:Protein of unknown function (DUF2490)
MEIQIKHPSLDTLIVKLWKMVGKDLCFLILPLLLSLLPTFSSAQSSTEATEDFNVNHQLWIDIYPHYFVNEKLEYYGDAGFRTIIDERSWNRIYARPSLRYHFNKTWEVHGGLGLFYIFNKMDVNRFEITPWQGVQLNWPTRRILSFKHLVKIEERLSFRTSDWTSSFDLRFRYKLSGKISLCKNCSDRSWYIPFYAEIFYPINDGIEEVFRNRGRAGLGLGYNASNDWRISCLVNWQTSRTGPEDELSVSDYAYQLKVRKLWKSKLLNL